MNLTKLITLSTLLLFVCVWSLEIRSMSGGALELTGINSGENCTACHQGVANSDNKGGIAIAIAGNPTYYEPGKTYDVSVTINYPSKTRFGFGLDIRKKGELSLPVGGLTATSNSGVSVRGNVFVTHESTSINATNTKTWNFKWTAPQKLDTFTFYTSGIAANNDKATSGDITYTAQKTLLPAVTTNIKNNQLINWEGIFPNPALQNITLQVDVKANDNYRIVLLDMKGAIQEILMEKPLSVGEQQLNFKFTNQYPAGIYIIQIVCGNYNTHKKIIIL